MTDEERKIKIASLEEENRITEPFYAQLRAQGLMVRCPKGKLPVDKYYAAGVIPMKDLIDGARYYGLCRNNYIATWHAKKAYTQWVGKGPDGADKFITYFGVFTYTRHKFGVNSEEDILTIEQDNGYDLFLPFKLKEVAK